MSIIYDVISFIKSLEFVDIVFFFAVLALMLLVITLVYFIEENKYEEISNEPLIEEPKTEAEKLKEITAALEASEPSTINLNNYEEEQEEKAIISYEELLSKKNDFAINYSEEENMDDLTIKKVDLDNLTNKEIEEKRDIHVTVISYEKEEAFLQALKTLQQTLN